LISLAFVISPEKQCRSPCDHLKLYCTVRIFDNKDSISISITLQLYVLCDVLAFLSILENWLGARILISLLKVEIKLSDIHLKQVASLVQQSLLHDHLLINHQLRCCSLLSYCLSRFFYTTLFHFIY
jgi:hypothetical protein